MKIYLAGLYETALTHLWSNPYHRSSKILNDLNYPHVLESYFYIQKGRTVKALRGTGQKVFLDSGAFSMFTQGTDVNLEEYAQFIQDNNDIIEVASNLDHIGRDGEQKSYDNQKYLESLGAKICPVHHARDDDKWLKKYLDEGYEYIFLGGMVPESRKYLIPWLDRIWQKYLIHPNGLPRVKVHGFGLTTEELMFRYPWHSIDSTRWVMAAANGTLLFDLGHRYLCFAVSADSPNKKRKGSHISTLSETEKKVLTDKIEEHGFDLDNLMTDYMWRWRWNIEYYKRVAKDAVETFTCRNGGLF